MSSPPPPAGQPTPQQIAQMRAAMAAEAQRRGMTPEQFQAQQRAQIEADARKAGMSFEAYVNKLKADAFANHQRQMAAQQAAAAQGRPPGQIMPGGPQQAQVQMAQGAPAPPSAGGQRQQMPQQHQHQHQQQVPIQNTGSPDPRAVALSKWLRSQELKSRTCILGGQRKEMFKVKRALRAIESPAYAKAASNPKSQLPKVTPEFPVTEVFKLLPLSLLALRVSKVDPHEGHGHAPTAKPKKRVKGLWTVKIEQQQDIKPELHYVFLYEGSQWKQKVYAGGALALLLAIVMFPLWPVKLRIGVWYLSMGMLGLIGLFFAMSIFRLILFVVTMFAVPPGLWLYPNLFEDVGFFDSFRPVWGWQEDKKAVRKAKKEARKVKQEAKASKAAKSEKDSANSAATPAPSIPVNTKEKAASTAVETESSSVAKRDPASMKASVEEVEED